MSRKKRGKRKNNKKGKQVRQNHQGAAANQASNNVSAVSVDSSALVPYDSSDSKLIPVAVISGKDRQIEHKVQGMHNSILQHRGSSTRSCHENIQLLDVSMRQLDKYLALVRSHRVKDMLIQAQIDCLLFAMHDAMTIVETFDDSPVGKKNKRIYRKIISGLMVKVIFKSRQYNDPSKCSEAKLYLVYRRITENEYIQFFDASLAREYIKKTSIFIQSFVANLTTPEDYFIHSIENFFLILQKSKPSFGKAKKMLQVCQESVPAHEQYSASNYIYWMAGPYLQLFYKIHELIISLHTSNVETASWVVKNIDDIRRAISDAFLLVKKAFQHFDQVDKADQCRRQLGTMLKVLNCIFLHFAHFFENISRLSIGDKRVLYNESTIELYEIILFLLHCESKYFGESLVIDALFKNQLVSPIDLDSFNIIVMQYLMENAPHDRQAASLLQKQLSDPSHSAMRLIRGNSDENDEQKHKKLSDNFTDYNRKHVVEIVKDGLRRFRLITPTALSREFYLDAEKREKFFADEADKVLDDLEEELLAEEELSSAFLPSRIFAFEEKKADCSPATPSSVLPDIEDPFVYEVTQKYLAQGDYEGGIAYLADIIAKLDKSPQAQKLHIQYLLDIAKFYRLQASSLVIIVRNNSDVERGLSIYDTLIARLENILLECDVLEKHSDAVLKQLDKVKTSVAKILLDVHNKSDRLLYVSISYFQRLQKKRERFKRNYPHIWENGNVTSPSKATLLFRGVKRTCAAVEKGVPILQKKVRNVYAKISLHHNQLPLVDVDAAVKSSLAPLISAKNQKGVFIRGGYIRDVLTDNIPYDVDAVTNYEIDGLIDLLKNSNISFYKEPTASVHIKGLTTFVCNCVESKDEMERGWHYDLSSVGSLSPEALRKMALTADFTCNTLFATIGGEVIDPLGVGVEACKKKELELVGETKEEQEENFVNDPIRFVRAVILVLFKGWKMPDNIKALIDKHKVKLHEIQDHVGAVIGKTQYYKGVCNVDKGLRDEMLKLLNLPKYLHGMLINNLEHLRPKSVVGVSGTLFNSSSGQPAASDDDAQLLSGVAAMQ